ncbi:MAG: ferrous iron transport protein A [Arcobacteraceae bacterium]
MTLDNLNKGETALILKVNAPQALKARLNSFGIVKDATVYLQEVTLAKNTIELCINKTKVALRISEASKIEVEKC